MSLIMKQGDNTMVRFQNTQNSNVLKYFFSKSKIGKLNKATLC